MTVIEAAPLPGVGLPIEKVPAPVQTATSDEIEHSNALDLSSFLTRRFNAVFANEIQNNPFQPDINYRGYTASPLLGTPQGLSVYMDGVRLNQPFGDVVSWDLIPRLAISTTTVMPGSNPLFGLNTLGGALAIQTKNGATAPGTSVQAIYGSDVRRSIEFEHGGRKASGLNWYVAGNLFKEDGWRDDSPSDVRQIFGKVGWQRSASEFFVSVGHANNSLNGNGLQEVGFLDRDYSSVYTKPDTTENRSTFFNVTGTPQSERTDISVRQRLLPRHPHGHLQRRHQRKLARPAGLSADCRRAGRTGRGRIHGISDERRERLKHAISRRGAASRMASSRTSPARSATA